MLITIILLTATATAMFGLHGFWVFVIGLAAMSTIEKRHPGQDFAESAAAAIFLLVVLMMALNFLLRATIN